MSRVRTKKRPANPIKEVEDIYDIQDYLKYHSKRNYVLFVLGISTGYRCGDLVKLKVRDIKEVMDNGYFEILEGKKVNSSNIRKVNIKPRKVKLIENMRHVLSNYISGMRDYEYLFQSRKGRNSHILVGTVSRILREAGEEFELKNITAHSLRKTFAYSIYVESDYNITLVKEMLGHSSENETKKYLGLDRETYDQYSDTLNNLIKI